MTMLSDFYKFYNTDDATLQAHHLKSGHVGYGVNGRIVGNAYTPAMMQFDGSTGFYEDTTLTASGDLVTAVCRLIASPVAGGSNVFFHYMGSTNRARMYLDILASDHANSDWQNRVRMFVQNSAGATICQLISTSAVTDGAPHTIFAAFNGTTGAATFYIDGSDADNVSATSRVAPTSGTLDTGAGALHVGSNHGETIKFDGQLGFCGVRDAYLTNVSGFMQTDGSPKALDESTWTEWGDQPLFWNPHGDMVNNLGSAGAMTKNGTINVGDGGAM